MLAASIPAKFYAPFAVSGTKNVIPLAASATPGGASLTTGFPPLTFTPLTAGGIPPAGGDFNGVLFQSTGWDQWYSAGGPVGFDAAFSTAVSGYPIGSQIGAASLLGAYWLSTVDGNVTNPDAGGSGWTFIRPGSWGAIQTGAGTANAITITLSPVPLSLASLVGTTLNFTVAQGNTGPATINPNTLGPLSLTRSDGAALASGDLATTIVYRGIVASTSAVQLLVPVTSQTTVNAPLNYCADTSGAANAIVATPVPAVAYTLGTTVRINPANNNTGAVTANISGGGVIAVQRPDGTACTPNDVVAGKLFDAVVDVLAGPTTVLRMLAWPWTGDGPSNTISGGSRTFVIADAQKQTRRSNSGTGIVDTLPGTGTAVLPAGWSTTIVNSDTTALYAVSVASGATFTGSGTISGRLVLGPGQKATITCDGTNYQAYGAPIRAKMTAATPMYVATTGSNVTGTGITAGSPVADSNYAYQWSQQALDLGQQTLTFNEAAGSGGSYNTAMSFNGPIVGQSGPVLIVGAGAGSTIHAPSAGNGITATNGALVQPSAMALNASGAGASQLAAQGAGAAITLGSGLSFGGNTGTLTHFFTFNGGTIILGPSYTVTAGSGSHWFAGADGSIVQSNTAFTVTLTGTPAFASGFAIAQALGLIDPQNDATFIGSATGPRYNISANGTINTSGSGATYLPGNSAGTGQTANYF